MPQFNINDLRDELAKAVAARQAYDANAGGTVVVWVEASNGVVLCVSDGDSDGEPFTREANDIVTCDSFAVGVYPSVESYEDGDMYGSLFRVPASLTALVAVAESAAFPRA